MATDNLKACIPDVSDADIDATQSYLGVHFDAARRDVLRSNDSFDVQACPGSGKTTLLVAKLAILAAKWPHARRGICVLSHTNVARLEIEEKLAGTVAGQRLLTYPHFIGTIHGFVNEFLSLPLLRSEGRTIRLIDDDACGEFCRRQLYSNRAYTKAKVFLAQKEQYSPDRTIRNLRYEGIDLTLSSAAGTLPCGPASDSFRILADIKQKASDSGLWRFDDMFAWGERLLAKVPDVVKATLWRFPAVFLDEMQDTSELQGHLLAGVFPSSSCGICQRFGDSNQAIFDGGGSATADPFPGANKRSIPNSQRFGPTIAVKAEPLAPTPSLVGEGPRRTIFSAHIEPAVMPHTIFLFDSDSIEHVFPAFGKLMLDTFPTEVLQSDAFLARAIGRVGRSESDSNKVPKRLGDYWTDYEPHAAKLEGRPKSLADYAHLAQRKRVSAVDCAEAVKTAVRGICDLAEVIAPSKVSSGSQSARWLWAALRDDETAACLLRDLIWDWCIDSVPVCKMDWGGQIVSVRRALHTIIGEKWTPEAEAFCQWSEEFSEPSRSDGNKTRFAPNRYRHAANGRFVDIDVGTIHSAKGQTHTATLLVETFFKKHDMEDLLQWISGEMCGASSKDGKERQERMRLVYTAMTRPSHLLCLAIRKTVIDQGNKGAETRRRLAHRGWKVVDLEVAEG
jgi:DNA helicase II / ATP-dependent DNA helicase PcrA